MNFVVIIPARFFSTRFPGKPLADIHGKPMIVRVLEIAIRSGADKVIVATDSNKIVRAIEATSSPVEICLTRSDHQSGTERLEEVAVRYKFADHQIIVHLQGDEPLIIPAMIYQVANALIISKTNMATLAAPIYSLKDIKNENIVKVVMDKNNYALYFSRSVIPWSHYKYFKNNQLPMNNIFLRHIGIYSYRACFLRRYVKWPRSILEEFEMLEQLRVLWQGEKIYVSLVKNITNIISVDTPEELLYVNKYFNNESL